MLEINFTLILFAISFLIFVYLLNLTLFKPVGKVIKDRKNLIDSEYNNSKSYRNTAEKLLEEYTAQIKLAKHDSHNTIQERINQTRKEKDKKVSATILVLSTEKEKALKQLQKEQETAFAELKSKISTLTDLITKKVLNMGNSLAKTS